jgi:hypothetical protein
MASEEKRLGRFRAARITGSNGILLMDETQLRARIEENQI